MRATPCLCAGATAALFLSACSTYDDAWPERDGLPDLAALEAARAAGDDADTVSAIAWIPLIHLEGESYEDSDLSLVKGTTYTDVEAYGPLFFAGGVEKFHYADGETLYEREHEQHFAWGLWQRSRSDVKVPSGWRVETESKLLWGLLRWPETVYEDRAPSTVRPAAGS